MNLSVLWRMLPFAVATLHVTASLASPDGAVPGAAAPQAAASSSATAASAPQAAASAPDGSAATPTASSRAQECPSPEIAFGRIREAAKLSTAEISVIEGGIATQAGEVVSNLLGFRGLFSAATGVTELSAHKKIADAIAADPCGERALEAFPKSYRVMYEAYQKQLKKK